jgi:hypothetical protein
LVCSFAVLAALPMATTSAQAAFTLRVDNPLQIARPSETIGVPGHWCGQLLARTSVGRAMADVGPKSSLRSSTTMATAR